MADKSPERKPRRQVTELRSASTPRISETAERAEPVETLRHPRQRNMLLGSAAGAVAVLLFAAAVVLAGPLLSVMALLSAAVAMASLWLSSRLGILAQPRGIFLGAGVAALAALLVPLAAGVVGEIWKARVFSPVPHAAAPAVQFSPDTPAADPARRVPKLSERFPVDRPDAQSEPWVEVKQASRIKINDEYYWIEAGERFALQRVAGEEALFKTRDFLVSLPLHAVEIHRPGQSAAGRDTAAVQQPEPQPAVQERQGEQERSPAQIMREAQALAIQRYPGLQIEDSRENRAYVEAYMKLKETNPEFFNDPEWPLQLAEAIAERDGWERVDLE